MTSLYDFSVLDQDNQMISLDTYRGNVLLVVNTATGCGLTPQYQGLQELYDRYQDQDFEILDFPCISSWDKRRAAQRRSIVSVVYIIKLLFHVLPRSRSTARKQILSMYG